jgi:hypothetical protein
MIKIKLFSLFISVLLLADIALVTNQIRVGVSYFLYLILIVSYWCLLCNNINNIKTFEKSLIYRISKKIKNIGSFGNGGGELLFFHKRSFVISMVMQYILISLLIIIIFVGML